MDLDQFLRMRDLRKTVGLGPTRIKEMEAGGQFPRRVRLGKNAVGWVASEVAEWMAERVAERDRTVAR